MHRRHLTLAGLAWFSGAHAAGHATLPPPAFGPGPASTPPAPPATPAAPTTSAAAIASSGGAPAVSLRLLSEEFPPINFTELGQPRGLSVDIVQAIQKRLGQSLPIEFMPWARAFREAQDGPPAALFSMARIPEREKLFQWVGPIVTFQSTFYAKAGSGIRLRSLAEAKRAPKVLVVRDWYTLTQLQSAGFHNLQQISDPIQGVRMLAAGRAPLFAAEKLSMPQTLVQAGVDKDALEEVFSFAASEGYIAFSRSTPMGTIHAWQSQLNEMKRDGTFQALYRRWLPHDAPPR
ncbi:substrate-binding periplasmic protein [Roseateles chitinivorans]|uniref:substrate-binding periplasmic protein n=1 Tax=Roseateles chitinivorans TaxID=2917965 RepID=UPI003D679D5B